MNRALNWTLRYLPAMAVFAAFIALWQLSVSFLGIREYLLPAPAAVLRAMGPGSDIPWSGHLWVTTVEVLGAFVLAAVSGIVLILVQGQGKADLANGYELDIIASSVVGGASLAGGRGSVIGAVLGTLIFGVLRNALPQIPGATFYDRLIVGLVVIVIVVMDQLLLKKRG